MKKTKASLWVIIATIATVLTLFWLPYTPKMMVHTALVQKGALYQTDLLEGTVDFSNEQPTVALCAGVVAQVCVEKGDRVQKGDLLYRLDTQTEEEALAMLITKQNEMTHLVKEVQGLTNLQQEAVAQVWSMQETEETLRLAIDSKQIRSPQNGIVGTVYIAPGDYVSSYAVLGSTHGEHMVVTVTQITTVPSNVGSNIKAVIASADDSVKTVVALTKITSPQYDESSKQYIQMLTFEPLDQMALQNSFVVGEKVTVEMIQDIFEDEFLIPLAAVDKQNRVWLVEDGVAIPHPIEVTKMNRTYVCCNQTFENAKVILEPDALNLYPNRPVKEQEE